MIEELNESHGGQVVKQGTKEQARAVQLGLISQAQAPESIWRFGSDFLVSDSKACTTMCSGVVPDITRRAEIRGSEGPPTGQVLIGPAGAAADVRSREGYSICSGLDHGGDEIVSSQPVSLSHQCHLSRCGAQARVGVRAEPKSVPGNTAHSIPCRNDPSAWHYDRTCIRKPTPNSELASK
jgi:hypothetical protein